MCYSGTLGVDTKMEDKRLIRAPINKGLSWRRRKCLLIPCREEGRGLGSKDLRLLHREIFRNHLLTV